MHAEHDREKNVWELTWQDKQLRLRLAEGRLMNDYFGPAALAAPDAGDRPFGDAIQHTRALASVELAPDAMQARWTLEAWSQPGPDTCVILLRDTDLPLQAELSFTVDSASGVLRSETTLRHTGSGPALDIRHAASAAPLLPSHVREVIHLSGQWGAETQVQRVLLACSPLLLESRAGKTGFEYAPYAALLAGDTTYLVELLWSGNWELHVRRLLDGRVALSAGLNGWGLRHQLRPGDALDLPGVLLACVRGDLNTATQRLHDYRRAHLRPDNARRVPVHYNSWYPFSEQVPVARMKQVATDAAELGCELFVLDAGWYTTEVEASNEGWWIRTGDWAVNRRFYPNGLQELSEHCRAQGVGFGIWFEPEAVGPSSRIRREHPEWLHALGGRPTPADQRGILHLGVPEARAFLRERILDVLRNTCAAWMKWDFNTDLRQGGWAAGLPDELTHEDPLVAHYRGLYQLQDELRAAMPEMTLEMCAGGGGRFDPAILSHAHSNWMSDQTQPLMNLAIHFGSQLAHCAVECNDWLVEWPPHSAIGQPADERGDLPFRARVAMLGTFGISAPLDRWSESEKLIVKHHVTWYRQFVQPLVHHGDQYLLTDAPPLDGNGDWAAAWYAAKDARDGVLFAFRLAGADIERTFKLPGLQPGMTYELSTPEGWHAARTGAELAEGLVVTCDEPFSSSLISVKG